MSADDKPFYLGDQVKPVFTVVRGTGHLDVQVSSSDQHIDVDAEHYVEIVADGGRVRMTRRRIVPRGPTNQENPNG